MYHIAIRISPLTGGLDEQDLDLVRQFSESMRDLGDAGHDDHPVDELEAVEFEHETAI